MPHLQLLSSKVAMPHLQLSKGIKETPHLDKNGGGIKLLEDNWRKTIKARIKS